MSTSPDWLPGIISVDGDIEKVIATLYSIYKRDFYINKKNLYDCYVWCSQKPSTWGGNRYEESFLHLITRFDYKIEDRLFDPRRSERLPWCGPAIENVEEQDVMSWEFEENNKSVRTYIWLKDYDYVVILQKRSLRKFDVYMLITAFYVDGPSKRKNLWKKYEKRIS